LNAELNVCARCLEEAETKLSGLLSEKPNPEATFVISEALSFIQQAKSSVSDALRRLESVDAG
jgi:hypothetical protein